ncbi:hypothetical protein [Marinospirillum sp.]|uniref:DUF6414 family protein n=1 Tax=Marinospirillum sp. TaxID=2183934 RepID=UPI0038500F61
MNLYDYIYVDLDKAISLYSQLTGGVVELKESQSEKGATADNKRNYDFKVFKHDAGGTSHDIEQNKVTIKPHHALLQELETELLASGYLFNLDDSTELNSLKDPSLRVSLKNALCIKCTGRIVIEDYERMKKIGHDFPDIVNLINRSHEDTLKNNPEYLLIENQIKKLEGAPGDRNRKAAAKQKAKELRAGLDSLVSSSRAVEMVPQWILDGMKTWIDAFLPKITNIRVYPSGGKIDEHIFGHLDAKNFTISDPTAFHFTYGSFPTEEFTMLGIITSVPSEDDDPFIPLAEFDKDELADHESVERAFRGMFRGFDGIEAMVRKPLKVATHSISKLPPGPRQSCHPR